MLLAVTTLMIVELGNKAGLPLVYPPKYCARNVVVGEAVLRCHLRDHDGLLRPSYARYHQRYGDRLYYIVHIRNSFG